MGLKALRQARRLTQEELSARSGLRRATISDIERGKMRFVRKSTLKKLEEALGVKADKILPQIPVI